MKQYVSGTAIISVVAVSILSLLIYSGTTLYLQQELEFGLILLLLVPCLFYAWYYRKTSVHESELHNATATILTAYALLYFVSIYFVHLLGSSISYWLVQFLIPVLIMKLRKEPMHVLAFRWRDIFSDFWVVLVAGLIILPVLAFNVRDAEQILTIAKTWKILVYFPLSVLYMFIVVGFWEEFFFRGVIMRSILSLWRSPALSILISALFFAGYHIPMRYYNARSPYFNDLPGSIAATVNEQFVMGLFLGFVVYKSKNVWHGVWLHSLLNGISFVYQLSTWLKL